MRDATTANALVVHGPALKAFRSSDPAGDVSKRTDELSKSGLQMHCLQQYHEGPETNAQRFAAGLRRCRQRRRGTYRRVAIAGIHLSATVGGPMIAIGGNRTFRPAGTAYFFSVRFWHLVDITKVFSDVCFEG